MAHKGPPPPLFHQSPEAPPPIYSGGAPGSGPPPLPYGYPSPMDGVPASSPSQPFHGKFGVPPPPIGYSPAPDGSLPAPDVPDKLQTHGTVVGIANDPEKDAKLLHGAMKGIGTDETAIINIVVNRTNQQRQQISQKFKLMYGKDLIRELKSELNGHMEDLLEALFTDTVEYDVVCLHLAMQNKNFNENILIEILVTRTNNEIKKITKRYKERYKRSLLQEIESKLSGHFKRFLLTLCSASRVESPVVDLQKASRHAQALYGGSEQTWGADENVFNDILCTQSFPQLRATFDIYQTIAGCKIFSTIYRNVPGYVGQGMLAMAKASSNLQNYFATEIYKALKGIGADHRTLIRCIVTRSEIDMVEIKQEFEKEYHATLSSFIEKDQAVTGDYNRLLVAIVGTDKTMPEH